MDRLRLSKKTVVTMVALLAVVMLCAAILTAWDFTPNTLSASADTVPEVTTTSNGKVTLGEMCERHDVLYAVVPDSYLDGTTEDTANAQSLLDLQAAGKLTIYRASAMLELSSDKKTLRGWASAFDLTAYTKVLLVVPNSITRILTADDGSDTYSKKIDKDTALLTGVAFESGSTLTAIPSYLFYSQSNFRFAILPESVTTIGVQAFACPQLMEIVMPKVEEIQSRAFSYYKRGEGNRNLESTSLYHVTIPETMTDIASDAFENATALCDVENNSDNITAAQLSALFPYAMNIYGTSQNITAGGQSYLRVWESYGAAQSTGKYEPDGLADRNVNNSLVFSFNNLLDGNDVLATTAGGNVGYTNKWYFVALDGVEDKNDDYFWSQTTEYHFPQTIDLTAERSNIKWDYLDSNGNKCVNVFSGATTVSEYDINACAVYGKRMTRIFLPEGVKVIGDYAFFASRVQALDIPSTVTHVGQHTFRQTAAVSNQHYYIRHSDLTQLNVGSYAFAQYSEWYYFRPTTVGGRSAAARKFIFADKDAYNSVSNLQAKFNMAGDTAVTYTYLIPINTYASGEKTDYEDYRLFNQNYNLTKNADASWTQKTDVALPTLDGNTSTVWYQAATDISNPTASKLADITYINGKLSANGTEVVNLYTKAIAAPDFEDQSYTYNASQEFTFADALKFTGSNSIDYEAEFVSFVNSNGETPAQSVVKNAGTYTLKVILNPQWGEWDDTRNYTYTVNVARAEIDLGNPDNLPEFVTASGALGGTEQGTTIYEYGDGYYLYAKSGDDSDPHTYTVTNSYARYTGNAITISAESGFNLYAVSGDSSYTATDSARILANFIFELENTNYVFVNKTFEQHRDEFSRRGISYNSSIQNSTSVSVTKIWFIVKQQNWLIDFNSTATNPENDSYSLLTLNGEAATSFVYESEFGSGKYEVHIPKAAKGTPEVKFTITYGSVNAPITVDTNGELQTKPVSDLSKYINSAMPAGNYVIKIYADAVEGENPLPAIEETIRLTVSAGTIDSTGVLDLLTGNTFEHAYNEGNLYLYDDDTNSLLASKLSSIQINTKRGTTEGVWSSAAYNDYYDTLAIKYNLDRMQTSEYHTLERLATWNQTQVPRNVGEYIVYYSLSARNYNTVGGANAADRRSYTFNTVIYRELSVSTIANIADMVYNGLERYPTIAYNQYYTHTFNGDNYTDVGTATVTFTITDTLLSRWSTESVPENVTIENGIATVTYEITPATNSWRVAPQMPSWTFNGFNTAVNFITSGLTFDDADVMYRLGRKDGNTIIWTNYFTVDSNGVVTAGIAFDDDGNATAISQADIIQELNLLKPANYYLESKVGDIKSGDVVNVTGGVFVAKDNLDNMLATVNITKANNRWTRSPSIIRWTWGEYNSARNIISSTSLYPATLLGFFNNNNIDRPVAEYQIYKYIELDNGDYSLEAINGLSVVNGNDFWFTAVNNEIAEILSGLDAGDYVLRARLAGTDYYTDIEAQDSIFDIARATNSWKYSPNVVRWDWSNYNKDINVITATPVNQPSDAVVRYTILNSDYLLANDALKNFTEVTEQIANVLANLPAGSYYLVASLEGTNNYLAINDWDTITQQEKPEGYVFGSAYDFDNKEWNKQLAPIPFAIGSINNSWVITPGMTSWQYKGFVPGNFIAGKPKNTPDGKSVKYTVTKPDNTSFDLVYAVNPQTGAVELDGDTVATLKALSVGTYQLRATLDGTDDYSELNYPTSFSVIYANNSWTTTPALAGWQYSYFVASNLREGVPAFNDENKDISYVITNSSDASINIPLVFTTNAQGKRVLDDDTVKALKALAVSNDYTLTVTLEGTTNYSEAKQEIGFSVSAASTNAWTTIPSISGWTYNNFVSTLLTEGKAQFGMVKYTVYNGSDEVVVVIVDGTEVNLENLSAADLVTYLALLDADDYVLFVEAAQWTDGVRLEPEDADYAYATRSLRFTVSRANDMWAIYPSMAGWTYGNEVGELTEGKPTVKSGNVSYNYYEAVYENGEWVKKNDNAIESLTDTTAAGDYVLEAIVKQDTNYNELKHVVHFVVAKADNDWKENCEPEDRLDWTWGDYSVFNASKLIIAESTVRAPVAYSIVQVLSNNQIYQITYGDSTVFDKDNIVNVLKTLGWGDYRITSSVAATDNYDVLTKITSVTVSKAKFIITEPSCSNWTWGADDSAKQFTDITVSTVLGTDNANITYKIGSYDYNDFAAMWTDLKNSNAGKHTVVIAVTCENYEDEQITLTVEIGKASFSWSTEPADSEWTWNGNSDEGKSVTEPKAADLSDNSVALTYTFNGTSYTDFDQLKEALFIASAGEHTITIAAANPDDYVNYEAINKSFKVTIGKATNKWTVAPQEEFNYEKEQWKDVTITEAKALFGEVKYSLSADGTRPIYNGTELVTNVEELHAWLASQERNDSKPYVYYTVVMSSSPNYDNTLSVKTEVYLTGTKSHWTNKEDGVVAESVELPFSNSLADEAVAKVDEAGIPVGNSGAGSTTYTLKDNKDNTVTKTSVDAVKDWIKDNVNAVGTYTVVSTFKPTNLNYTDLTHTLTIVVVDAAPAWDTTLDDEYYGQYGSIDVPTPTVTGYSAPITITLDYYLDDANHTITVILKDGEITEAKRDGNVISEAEKKSFTEFVKTLNAVTTYYSVNYYVAATSNYEGLATETSKLYISPILNAWLADTEAGITADDWVNGKEWQFTRGDKIAITIPTAIAGNSEMLVQLDSETQTTVDLFKQRINADNFTLPAGTHTLTFTIPQSGNYNGLVSNCQIVVNKISNSWNNEFVGEYNGKGSVTIAKIGTFDDSSYNAKVQLIRDIDLLRFKIVNAAGKVLGSELVYGAFCEELAKLANGTFTVTAYIGGNDYTFVKDSLSDFALAEYNSNYNLLTSVCVITLTPDNNEWKTTILGQTWTWHNTGSVTLTRPNAEYGNETIVYTVKQGNNTIQTFTASDYQIAQDGTLPEVRAFNDLVVYLTETLDSGTYSVTVSIKGTETYYAPSTLTAVFVINKVVTEWNVSDTELAKYEDISGVWNDFDGTELPELKVANWGSAVIKYTVGEENVTGEYTNAWKNAFTMLKAKGAGVYTFKATVKGDDNHTDLTFTSRVTATKIQSSWSPATNDNNGKSYSWPAKSANEPAIDQPSIKEAASNEVTYYTLRVRGGNYVISSEDTDINADWTEVITKLMAQPSGEYILAAYVAEDNRYTALNYSVNVVISAAENGWKTHMNEDDKEDFSIIWTYGAIGTINYEATYGDVAYTVDGSKVADLTAALANLNAGDHAIVAYVDATTEYSGISETIKLQIKKALNSWDNGLEIKDWEWNDANTSIDDFTASVPAQGTTAIVTVRKGGETALEAIINYSVDATTKAKTVNENDYVALVRKLCALDVGTYTISITVNELDNYLALTTDAVEFKITQAKNAWTASGSPTIAGWDFGGSTAYPSANPLFGKNTVIFSYAEWKETHVYDEEADELTGVNESEWSAAPSYTAGAYWLRAYVPGTDNYTELYGYHKFNINAAKNDWVKMPGVVEWSWNGYDKDVNLFSGSARSNQPAAFTITKTDNSDLLVSDFNVFGGKIVLDDGTEIVINNASLQSIRTALTRFTLDGDGKVREKVAKILNALIPGSYRLTVKIDGGESLDAISGYTYFTVSKANNEWTTAPNVLSYDYNGYVVSGDRASFNPGVSKYGAVSYAVRSGNKYLDLDSNGNVTDSDSLITLNAAKVAALLPKLDAGNYALQAWVSAEAGATYNPFATDSHYSVLFGVSRIENGWTTATQNSIEKYYTELHAMTDAELRVWFTEKETKYKDEIAYTLLNTNYSPAKYEEGKPSVATVFTYEQLLNAILTLDSGDYVIRMTVRESGNYLALSADTSLTIKRQSNEFTTLPNDNIITGQWKQGNATTLNDFTVEAQHGTHTIMYALGSNASCDKSALSGVVESLNAGSYQVTVTVAPTNEYEGISATLQLNIAQGENELDWSLDTLNWTWHNGLEHFTANPPKYGTQLTVEITNTANSNSSSTITIDFSVAKPLSIINQVICGTQTEEGIIIGGLDAGTYTIKVTARADDNWAETFETNTFTITKTTNDWAESPALDGTLDGAVYKYQFGNTITPTALAQHGTVKYAYYTNNADYENGNAKPLSGKPANVGKYVLEVSVDATTNHDGIAATKLYFDIDKVSNESFIVSPAAVGWTWGSYDRMVHMFTGIPRSGGNVSFSILNENKEIVSVGGIALDKMLLVGLTKDGEQHYNDVDKDMYLESKFVPLVAKLVEGNYYVQINVEETTNNNAFTATAPFRVDAAENGWKVTPKIASWSLGLWDESKNSPQAEPRFGTAHIVVTSQNNNEVFYDNMFYNAEKGEYEVLNRLESALAGWYTMTVTVDALQGCYTGLEEPVDVQVYMRGSKEINNYWYETFGINPWEAIVGGIGNEPFGLPLRGLPYFEFYYAKGEGSNAVIDWDRPVVAGADSYLVKKGDNKYYKDFYVPMAPGYYFMVACAVNVDSDGNVIEADTLRESKTPYPLHIENRANSFTDDPHIDTLLFLGERGQWAEPTAKAFLVDSEIWYTYHNAETGEDLGRNKPTAEGKYIVTAHAKAKYSEEITKEAKFTVELSTNEWITQPTIESWSEEFEANAPEAEAMFGEVVYTYENLDTHEIKNDKPTTEGTYKMTATVKLEGYRDLVGSATFTIEPAYDSDLILIDIVLGCVACALAIFVIIFAIRRYKEN